MQVCSLMQAAKAWLRWHNVLSRSTNRMQSRRFWECEFKFNCSAIVGKGFWGELIGLATPASYAAGIVEAGGGLFQVR
eukprot:636749-Amphidinium_carterae.1